MAFVDFDSARQSVRMTDPGLVQIAQAEVAFDDFWRWSTTGGDEVELEGRDLTYAGQGRATGGRITEIGIDDGDNGVAPDIAITSGNFAAAPLDDSAQSFWNVVLGGNDIIDASGLALARLTDLSTSELFGDDLASATGSSSTQVSDRGGNDVLTLADGKFRVAGDVQRVEGNSTPGNFAVYQAGADQILAPVTDLIQELYGDGFFVGVNGVLRGGNDLIKGGSTEGGAQLVGDVRSVNGSERGFARVEGGDDRIETVAGSESNLVGDVDNSGRFTTVVGGDDTIVDSNLGNRLAGDVRFFQAVITTDPGSVVGGDDTISGNGGDDFISGDVDFRGTVPLQITGGNDVLRGGAGNDRIFGELGTEGALPNVKGGNDELFGDAGNDRMFGQTGNDKLFGGLNSDVLNGGAGKDRLDGGLDNDDLRGGAGADVFVFGPLHGRDIVRDFENGSDKFDVSANADFGDLAVTAVDAERNGQVNDVSIVLFNQTIVVLNRPVSAIDATDFLF